MAITNLILKPFTSFVLFRIYQDRGGQYSDFRFPEFGSPGKHRLMHRNGVNKLCINYLFILAQ